MERPQLKTAPSCQRAPNSSAHQRSSPHLPLLLLSRQPLEALFDQQGGEGGQLLRLQVGWVQFLRLTAASGGCFRHPSCGPQAAEQGQRPMPLPDQQKGARSNSKQSATGPARSLRPLGHTRASSSGTHRCLRGEGVGVRPGLGSGHKGSVQHQDGVCIVLHCLGNVLSLQPGREAGRTAHTCQAKTFANAQRKDRCTAGVHWCWRGLPQLTSTAEHSNNRLAHRVERSEAEVRFLKVDHHSLGAVRLLCRKLVVQVMALHRRGARGRFSRSATPNH